MPKSAETKKTGVNLVEKKKRDSMNTIGTRKSIGAKANLEKKPRKLRSQAQGGEVGGET